MAKQGMKRPDRTHTRPKNDFPPVPEIKGKAKHGKERANPIIAGTHSPSQKVYHSVPVSVQNVHDESIISGETDKPISAVYPVIDNDLARDNLENDIPDADLQDL